MAKPEKKSLKFYIGKLHLWLGFSTGLVVFIVAVTGCLYCFQEEITALYDDYKYVEARNEPFIAPSEARDLAHKVVPDRTIHGIAYGDKTDAIEVVFYEPEPEFYQLVYLNPYSGEFIKHVDVLEGFFHFILEGHIYLWMGEFGRIIVSYSTLIFLFILISGLILWFPRKRKNAKKRFKFQWNERTKRKRKNYDLHNILGFYASAIALVIAITGLVMALPWFQNTFYTLTGGDKDYAGFEYPKNITHPLAEPAATNEEPVDIIWRQLMQEYSDAHEVEIHIPPDEEYTIYAHMSFSEGTYWDSDYRYFDSRTLEEVKPASPYGKLKEASVPDLIRLMNYDFHVGAIGGITGKIIVFFSALIVGSLPVTGFMVWWGRRRNNNKKPSPKSGKQTLMLSRNGTANKQKHENSEWVEV